MTLTPKETGLSNLLFEIPPRLDCIRHYISDNVLTSEEITRTAVQYTDDIGFDAHFHATNNQLIHSEEVIPSVSSAYLFEIIQLLLPFGLDPNAMHNGCSVMESLQFIDNGFLAADTLALLLDHGGDPLRQNDGESFFDSLQFSVFFNMFQHLDAHYYASIVHCYMVLIGYGYKPDVTQMQAYPKEGQSEENLLQGLRNHRNYSFETLPENDGTICFFEKETGREVFRAW